MKWIFSALMLISTTTALGSGLTLSIPVVGRVKGPDGTLYATAIDVSNNGATAVSVDYFYDGKDVVDGSLISTVGTIATDGGLVDRGGGTMRSLSSQHFDDFIDALVDRGKLPLSVRNHGVQGSLLLVFNGYTKRGQGSATARFYNPLSTGTVGVALKAHEVETNEPTQLVSTLRETSTTYANLFINNTGLTTTGVSASGNITVELTAFSARTGQAVGSARTITLEIGETFTLSPAFQALNVSASSDDTIIVKAKVTAGNATIAGVVSQVDRATKDGSAFEMSRGDF